MYKTALLSVVAANLAISPARADSPPSARFLLDGAVGMAAPVADSLYRNSNYPGPTFGLHLGAELWLSRRVGLAPELALEGGPIIGRVTVNTGRLRVEPGLRVLFAFGKGHAVFARVLIGADLLIPGAGAVAGLGKIDAGLVFEPGGGVQFRISRRAVAGFTVGVPVAVHSFHTPSYGTQADFQLAAFVGYRR